LDHQDFIDMSPEDTSRHRLEILCVEREVKRNAVAETYYSSTACELALAGVGIALVNPIVAKTYLTRGLIVKPFDPPITLNKTLILPPDRQQGPILQSFIRCLLVARNELHH